MPVISLLLQNKVLVYKKIFCLERAVSYTVSTLTESAFKKIYHLCTFRAALHRKETLNSNSNFREKAKGLKATQQLI